MRRIALLRNYFTPFAVSLRVGSLNDWYFPHSLIPYLVPGISPSLPGLVSHSLASSNTSWPLSPCPNLFSNSLTSSLIHIPLLSVTDLFPLALATSLTLWSLSSFQFPRPLPSFSDLSTHSLATSLAL